MTERNISDYLNNELREYSMYTIESRAIPSVIDGLKISSRKVIHASNKVWRNRDLGPKKVFQLTGIVSSDCYYHHGDASMNDTIIKMAQDFKNNLPLLDKDGQVGTLKSPTSGAPRYVGVKLSKNFDNIFKDNELLQFRIDDGHQVEPYYFLPIIPMVLINSSQGIATGFTSKILTRDPLSVIKSCISFLSKGKALNCDPKINTFIGSFVRDPENHKRWIIRGRCKIENTSTVSITELPPSMTYEGYQEELDKLIDKKIISSYEDRRKKKDKKSKNESNIDIIVKFTRDKLSKYDEDSIYKILKLEEYFSEAFNTLDDNGKLIIFDNEQEIIEYFCNFRLSFYEKRKHLLLDKYEKDKMLLSNKGKFIQSVLKGELILNNRSKKDVEEDLVKMNFDKIDDGYDYLLRMFIGTLTIEMFNKIKEDFIKIKKDIEVLNNMVPKDAFINELKELYKKIDK